jgi:hypothetical protein
MRRLRVDREDDPAPGIRKLKRVNKGCQAQNNVVTLELLWFRGVGIAKKACKTVPD